MRHSMIQDIIFDWDGTLADTLPFLKETFNQTFAFLKKKPISYAQIRRLSHQNKEIDLFQSVFGEDDFFKAKCFFYTYTLQHHLDKLSACSGAQEVLDFCKQANIKCHVFSHKRQQILEKEIERLGWKSYFSNVCGAGTFSQDKPAPEACEKFWQCCGANPKTSLVIGDGPSDTTSARFWGCSVAIVATHERYIGEKPDYKLKNLQEILPLLQTMLY